MASAGRGWGQSSSAKHVTAGGMYHLRTTRAPLRPIPSCETPLAINPPMSRDPTPSRLVKRAACAPGFGVPLLFRPVQLLSERPSLPLESPVGLFQPGYRGEVFPADSVGLRPLFLRRALEPAFALLKAGFRPVIWRLLGVPSAAQHTQQCEASVVSFGTSCQTCFEYGAL